MDQININQNMDKRVYTFLRNIVGIGHQTAHKIILMLGVNNKTLMNKLSKYKISRLKDIFRELQRIKTTQNDKYPIGLLRQQWETDCIEHKINLGSYEGSRHALRLPVRGQRTRTNANTISNRKKPL